MLTTVATVIASQESAIMSKYSISATPGGTKKNPMLETRNRHMGPTSSTLIAFFSRSAVSNNIPRILPGMEMPVSHTMSSPTARHPKMMKHCFTISQ